MTDAATQVKEALEDIGQTINEKHAGLSDQVRKLDDRLFHMEQAQACAGAGPWPHTKEHKHQLARTIKAAVDPRFKLDGLEAEWHQEFMSKTGLDIPGAVWAPLSTKAVDYAAGSPTAGGSSLVETELRSSEFIDILRQQSVVMDLNPRMLNATGDLDIPKSDGGSTAVWFDGDGGSITESTPSFTTIQLRPKFCAGYVRFNYRMAVQTGGAIEDIVRRDIGAQVAAEIDNQAINGDGTSNKPTGILSTSGINSTTWANSPAVVAWEDVLELEKLLLDDKAVQGTNLHYLVDPATWKTLKQTTKVASDAGAGFLVDFDGGRAMLNGHPVHVSTHVPANTLIFGNFDELLIAMWGGIAFMSDPYTDFGSGKVGVRGIVPLDINVRHAVSFAKSTP